MVVIHLVALSYLLLDYGVAAATGNTFERTCTRFAQTFKAPDTRVLLSEYVAKNTTLNFAGAHPTCSQSQLVSTNICRLKLNVTTSRASNVILEAWLPVDWEAKGRRFLMTGNGGLGGCIGFPDMAYGAYLGFASIGHNNGHDGDIGLPFLNNPDVVKDYSYRALTTATKISKLAVKAFYSKDLKKAYFMGCSAGGRQGLKAAQTFPDEYDGIIASAPGVNLDNLFWNLGRYALIVGTPGSPTHLTTDQWLAVTAAVFQQCDEIDGVADMILEDPRKCVFRPEAMLCSPGQTWETSQCLTSTQVLTVRTVYEPFYGTKGQLLFPRMLAGGDPIATTFLFSGTVLPISDEFLKYAIYNDPAWSFKDQFNRAAVESVDAMDLYGISGDSPNLRGYKESGGKLMMVHGLSDGLLTPENSFKYYEDVVRNMSLPSPELSKFFRFFPISGMNHCAGGQGSWFFGGPLQGGTPGAIDIPSENSILMKLARWVEKGEAPETILAYKLGDTGVQGSKEHCNYPKQNKYKGTGNPDLKESWECK